MTDALSQLYSAAASESSERRAISQPPDDVVDALARPRRQAVLRYLAAEADADERISIDILADASGVEAARLHHTHLPKLDDAGLLSYDADEHAVVPDEGLTGGEYDDLLAALDD